MKNEKKNKDFKGNEKFFRNECLFWPFLKSNLSLYSRPGKPVRNYLLYRGEKPMNLMNRAKAVTCGEDGASNLEFIVLASVTLVIATVLFIFRDQIMNFINSATSKVGAMTGATNNGFGNTNTTINHDVGNIVTPGF